MRYVSPARLFWATLLTWCGTYAVTLYLLLAGYMQPLPFGVYAEAGRRWLQSRPLYDLSNIDGFQYFLPAALIFAPFAALGAPWGDLIWRAANWLRLATGLWRTARQHHNGRPELCWAIATALA